MSTKIHARTIIGTPYRIYSAWSQVRQSIEHGQYGTVSTLGTDYTYGRIGTYMPDRVIQMPPGEARMAEATSVRSAQERRAYALILAAHPELLQYARIESYGEIEIDTSQTLPF